MLFTGLDFWTHPNCHKMPCLIPEMLWLSKERQCSAKCGEKTHPKYIVNGCGGSDFPINIFILEPEEILHNLVEGLHYNTSRQLEFL